MESSTTLFVCASVAFSRQDVLTAADAWGKLGGVRDDACLRLACLHAARDAGLSCGEDELQTASEAFRRAHGLRNGDLTRAWMARWQVSVVEFGDYLEREELLRHYRGRLAETLRSDLVDAAALDEVLWPDAVFTGNAERWCEALAARTTAAAALGDTSALFAPWPERLKLLDAALQHFASRAATPEATQAALESHWRDYLVFDCEFGHFATVESALEARLCVEEDGAELASVCAEAGGRHHRARVLHVDLPAPLRAAALSCAPGAIIPPMELSGEHVLCRVLAKDSPDLNDADTRVRVQDNLLAEALRPLMTQQVAWPGEDAR